MQVVLTAKPSESKPKELIDRVRLTRCEVKRASATSPLFEITLLLVRFDHVVGFIVNQSQHHVDGSRREAPRTKGSFVQMKTRLWKEF
jgi:hypothetical protein